MISKSLRIVATPYHTCTSVLVITRKEGGHDRVSRVDKFVAQVERDRESRQVRGSSRERQRERESRQVTMSSSGAPEEDSPQELLRRICLWASDAMCIFISKYVCIYIYIYMYTYREGGDTLLLLILILSSSGAPQVDFPEGSRWYMYIYLNTYMYIYIYEYT